jgi:hypothetical protein
LKLVKVEGQTENGVETLLVTMAEARGAKNVALWELTAGPEMACLSPGFPQSQLRLATVTGTGEENLMLDYRGIQTSVETLQKSLDATTDIPQANVNSHCPKPVCVLGWALLKECCLRVRPHLLLPAFVQ